MKVMLVDDEPSFHVLVQSVCESAGHEFRGVGDSRQAIEVFKAYAPDVVLLDIMMPVMDGLEAARGIRALERPDAARVPIIAMTANAFADDVRRSLQAGFTEHLSKPLDSATLVSALRRARVVSDQCK